MFGEGPFTDDEVSAILARGWALRCESIVYTPVGFGSYHWLASGPDHTKLFVTVDDFRGMHDPTAGRAAAAALQDRFRSTQALANAGLGFVRGPISTFTGDASVLVEDQVVVSLWRYIEGRSSDDGEYTSDQDRRAVLDVLASLHNPALAGDLDANAEDFVFRNRDDLEQLLANPADGWDRGPFGTAARQLFADHRNDVERLLEHYDDLVAAAPPRDTWVVTHGEPHAANVLFTASGPVLIDWDTLQIAPPERDLWMVMTGSPAVDGAYTHKAADPIVLRLYQAQWELSELATYLGLFRGPHGDGADERASWDDLNEYLPLGPRW